jgi:hypothetical protein
MQKTSFQHGTLYLDKAIDDAGYLPNIKAREQMRASIEANYSGQYLSAVLREVVNAHAHMLVKKAVEPVAKPTAAQNAEAINKHVQEVIRQLSVEFPDINFLTSAHNNKILGEFVDSQGGNITMVAMRTAVRLMHNLLEKNPPPPPPPVPEPEPPKEVLRVLSDGTTQLSLECSEWEIQQASKSQLKDWLRRKDEKKYGGFDGRL